MINLTEITGKWNFKHKITFTTDEIIEYKNYVTGNAKHWASSITSEWLLIVELQDTIQVKQEDSCQREKSY